MGKTAYDLAQQVVRRPVNETSRVDQPIYVPAPPPRSAVGSFFRFLGITVLVAMGLFAAVTITSVWVVSDTARDIFNLDTKTTIISNTAVVESIKEVNKQVFVEHYNTVDIDYTEAPEGWLGYLPIQQSFIVLLKGRVPAGFDLSQLSTDDVWVSADGQRIQLVLPAPVIFIDNINVDFENSRVISQGDTCPDFLCQDQLTSFKDQMLPQGRALLMQASVDSGILAQTAEDGQRYYEQFLKSLGFAEVRVIVRQAENDD